jgi:hypothetical protein
MIFLIVEDLLLTTNIEELKEKSDQPTTTKDGEYCTGSTLCLYSYLLHINYFQLFKANHYIKILNLRQIFTRVMQIKNRQCWSLFKFSSRSFYLCFNIFMLKQIYEAINRRHFETVFNITVLTHGIWSDIPILISHSDCRNSLDTLL